MRCSPHWRPASEPLRQRRARPGHRRAAARLCREAFRGKLGRLLGPDARGVAFFEATLQPGRVIAATKARRAAWHRGFPDWRDGVFRRNDGRSLAAFGVSSLWRMVPLAALERESPQGVLQMDGICVAREARGSGVGTALFEALLGHARALGCHGITLDVIDSNPRVRALYERLGFVAMSESLTGPLRPLPGFASAPKMRKTLVWAACAGGDPG